MRIDTYKIPQSSFLSVDKDLEILINLILSNESLKKLLYYPTSKALREPRLTAEQESSLFKNGHIRITPKIYIDPTVLTYIVINFDNFVTSPNIKFRDNVLSFDIICHYDQWALEDNQLRPYRIAAELDSMLMAHRLTGIGKTEFLGCTTMLMTDEFAGLKLQYYVYHGEEDKKDFINPEQNENFIEEFNERENS